uniref:Transmembrane protein n=1 Tax=Trichogramma kaykai TaxID=54128 RepID=A0ABD2W4R7_9HYME
MRSLRAGLFATRLYPRQGVYCSKYHTIGTMQQHRCANNCKANVSQLDWQAQGILLMARNERNRERKSEQCYRVTLHQVVVVAAVVVLAVLYTFL